ncbi:MAG TPA: patatin-like phospholipase family protein, partial [Ignavibacteria bacterium]|nr:patatin-like phospholipase family protein [Ignavibacteria bacterium]
GKFGDKQLKNALVDMLGTKTMGDSDCLLCIPSFDYTNFTYTVFKYDHREGNLSRNNMLPMVDVALATSAAPTYFPLAQIEQLNKIQLVDGGVWCNNPSLVGFMEALRYFAGPGKQFDSVSILSLSSMNNIKGKPPLMKRKRSFLNWAPDLFELGLTGQNEFTDVVLSSIDKYIQYPLSYLRIPSPEISAEQQKYISLDLATDKAFILMKTNGDHMYHQYKNNETLVNMFREKKLYRTK